MEAYDSEDKEKGLFTFYREQAEEEDKIKKRKKEQIAKMRQLEIEAENNTTLNEQITQKSIIKTSQKPKKQLAQQKKQMQKEQAKIESQKQHKEFQKKLLQILEKHKYDRSKRRNLRVIMKLGEDNEIGLKYNLQALMQQQNELNNHESAKNKNDLFIHKKGPTAAFQRVALCPTNFQVELDENIPISSKNVISKKVGNISNSNPKRLDKLYQDIKHKQEKQVDMSQILQRNLLPKINVKANNLLSNNSVCINKEEMLSARERMARPLVGSVPLHKLSKMKSMRDKSLCVESARYNNEASKIKQSCENRIYPIFIENHQSKKYEEDVRVDKQKMFVEIIRKLKFK